MVENCTENFMSVVLDQVVCVCVMETVVCVPLSIMGTPMLLCVFKTFIAITLVLQHII